MMKYIRNKIKAFAIYIVSKRSEPFSCYEIWRPNIPDDGCKAQCKECKEKQDNVC